MPKQLPILALSTGMLVAASLHAQEDSAIEEIVVIGTTPGSGLGVPINKIPFAVSSIGDGSLQQAQSLDLTDYLNHNAPGVNINSAQNNPLQPDLLFRGFTASPLLGLPQGLAVYQNGARINEPLGDSVNWDLLPESAIHRVDVISGADPLFGLNTLGGALVLKMKDGFTFTGNQAEVGTGSWGRRNGHIESGGNDGALGYYVNLSHFQEDGWRPFSHSESSKFYSAISWREDDSSTLDLTYQRGDSDLRGNGPTPVGLMAVNRKDVFTAPDITDNLMDMVTLDVTHFLTPDIQIVGSAFWRKNRTHSFNGDASEYGLCQFAGGEQSLFEEFEDVERALDEELGIDLEAICEGELPAVTGLAELESLIAGQAVLAGLEPDDYMPEDITDELSGTGVLIDEAINNISNIRQETTGFDGKLIYSGDLFGHESLLTVGGAFLHGESAFNSVVELSGLDPVMRSTEGLGVASFVEEAATQVRTETENFSLFFVNTLDLTDRLTLTVGGRYNHTDVTLRDRSGVRPELNGDHTFTRFNPSAGFTFDAADNLNAYLSYSESNRVPTPIELACNEGVFTLAQEFALAEGEDPEDIEFECRLPNAFLADPPLDDVVTQSMEMGVRGLFNTLTYRVGLFHTENTHDILFQTTGRSTGLFANVDKTRRMGFESVFSGTLDRLDWYASLSVIKATFEDDFDVLSPNNPGADDEGVVMVHAGDHLPGVPENLLKIGGDYHLGRLTLGAEAMYNSSQYLRGDESNDLAKVSGYALVNLRALYQVGDNFSVFARVTNVLDKKYENFGLLGEDPTEVLPLQDNRPIFLGVGAPRAATLGVRVRF